MIKIRQKRFNSIIKVDLLRGVGTEGNLMAATKSSLGEPEKVGTHVQ